MKKSKNEQKYDVSKKTVLQLPEFVDERRNRWSENCGKDAQ